MRKLGIIGRATWHTTALYYDQINRGIGQRLGGIHSARLIIESLDFADYAALQESGDWATADAMIVAVARRLAGAGADGLLLACNTMHMSPAAVAAAVPLPLLDIRDATAARIVGDGRTRVALLVSILWQGARRLSRESRQRLKSCH